LVNSGIPVQYWNGKGDFPEEITNARIIILDLDLAKVGIRGPNFYLEAAKVLKKIPGPYIAIILALDYDKDDSIGLKKYYDEHYPDPLCGFIAKKGLTKAEEATKPTVLRDIILEAIEGNDVLKFILTWEQIIEKSKDLALHNLFEKELETTITALTKSFCKGLGEEAAAREMTALLLQLVIRKVTHSEALKKLTIRIDELNKSILENTTEYPTENDLALYNKLMYYTPQDEEPKYTGDIFRTEKEFYQYAIILTPRCDVVQEKTQRLLFCYGVPLEGELFKNPNYPLHKIDTSVLKRHKAKKTLNKIEKYMKERYFQEANLPETLFVLWNFCHDGETLGICFDFNNVQSIKINEINWQRISRLDSPFIEEMLEKYGSVVSRVGTMEINMNKYQLSKTLEEIEGKTRKK